MFVSIKRTILLFLAVFSLNFLGGCAGIAKKSRFVGLTEESFYSHGRDVIKEKTESKAFEKRGPFGYEYNADLEIPISEDEILEADFIKTSASGKSPLLVFVHGNYSRKEVHSFQAQRLATWGFNTLSIDLPPRRQWVQNGDRLTRLVNYINAYPEILSQQIDTNKIILIGHSFGGSASIIAAGSGAPVAGIILLDPAVVHQTVIEKMSNVEVPVILLGADEEVYKARKRKKFFRKIQSPMIELSIVDATHNEAQFPSLCSLYVGFSCHSQDKQKLFVSKITVSAFSLALNEGLDFAWRVFTDSDNKGIIKNLKIKGTELMSSNDRDTDEMSRNN